jgi:thiol-disulfide isomerase/thioredoxin
MREVILVGASWCGVCKAMMDWFGDLALPSIVLRYADVADSDVAHEGVSTLPTILFREGRETLQKVSGAMSRNDLEHTIQSLWMTEYATDMASMPGIPYKSADENYLLNERVLA